MDEQTKISKPELAKILKTQAQKRTTDRDLQQDLIQATTERLWKAGKLDEKWQLLDEIDTRLGHTIVNQTMIDILRKQKIGREKPTDEISDQSQIINSGLTTQTILLSPQDLAGFNERDQQIILWGAAGFSRKQIADTLEISVQWLGQILTTLHPQVIEMLRNRPAVPGCVRMDQLTIIVVLLFIFSSFAYADVTSLLWLIPLTVAGIVLVNAKVRGWITRCWRRLTKRTIS